MAATERLAPVRSGARHATEKQHLLAVAPNELCADQGMVTLANRAAPVMWRTVMAAGTQ